MILVTLFLNAKNAGSFADSGDPLFMNPARVLSRKFIVYLLAVGLCVVCQAAMQNHSSE
jgi:hypothetical protein